MVSVLVSKTLRAAAALTFAAAIQMAVMANSAHATAFYDYAGNKFTTTVGGLFTTDHSITGFVEFTSQPAPGGMFDESDVLTYSFSAGPLTITSDSATSESFEFVFDSTSPVPAVDLWFFNIFAIGAEFLSCNSLSLLGCNIVGDIASDLGANFAENNTSGAWTARPKAVPEPGTLWLLLTGLAALVLVQALGRRRGRPARP